MLQFMEGYRTYSGGIILFLSWLLKDYATKDEITEVLNALFALGGIALVVYGRVKAKK